MVLEKGEKMLPIHLMYDSGIQPMEEMAILDGLHEVLEIFPKREAINYGAKPWIKGEFSSADWYVDHASKFYRPNGDVQLDADDLIDLMRFEPWQEKQAHIDMMFTSLDLTTLGGDGYLDYVFGAADGRFTVQSVARFRDIPLEHDRILAIKNVVQHELGHIFGMANDLHRENTVEDFGPHCTNFGCVMRQAITVSEWVQNARDSYQMGIVYCKQCLMDGRCSLI